MMDPSSHLLTVAEVDSCSPAQTGTASVLISVEDVNDSIRTNLSLLENSTQHRALHFLHIWVVRQSALVYSWSSWPAR